MSFTGVTRAPLPIPDVNQLRVGQRPSTPTFFLRSTPPVFTVLNVGGSNTNQDFAFRPAEIPTYLQFVPTAIKISRGVLPVEPFTTTKTLQLAIGGAGSVSSNLTVTRSFASSILGFTVVAVELSRERATTGAGCGDRVSALFAQTPAGVEGMAGIGCRQPTREGT